MTSIDSDYPGMMIKSEAPLLVTSQVALLDPSDSKPTEVGCASKLTSRWLARFLFPGEFFSGYVYMYGTSSFCWETGFITCQFPGRVALHRGRRQGESLSADGKGDPDPKACRRNERLQDQKDLRWARQGYNWRWSYKVCFVVSWLNFLQF